MEHMTSRQRLRGLRWVVGAAALAVVAVACVPPAPHPTTTTTTSTTTTESTTTTTESTTTTTAPPTFTPAVSYSATAGLPQSGGQVVVSGSGFDPSLVTGGVAGVYVAIGIGAGPVPTAYTSAKFVRPTGPDPETGSGAKLQSDGTFVATIATPALFVAQGQAVNCYIDACKVFVFSAHTGSYSPWNFQAPVTFAAATTPQVVVSKTANIANAGETVTATGAGFSTTFPGIYLGQVPWTQATAPSTWSSTDAAEWGDTVWISTTGPDPRAGAQAHLNADGSFRTTLSVQGTIGASGNDCSTTACSIATVRAHGFADLTPSQTTWTPITVAAPI
jgi:hypothetical protein